MAAAWAALAGVFYGLNNQITPVIGRDLVLPIFAATIVGGIGSIYGALLGGFVVGDRGQSCGDGAALGLQSFDAVPDHHCRFVDPAKRVVRRGTHVIGLVSYLVFFAIVASILAIAVLGLNLQWGNTGLFNGGVVAFFGAGAYGTLILGGGPQDGQLGGFGLFYPLALLGGDGNRRTACMGCWNSDTAVAP